MQDFKALGLPQQLMNSLEKLQFTTPTPIQAQVIPHALEGKDILGSAQTGTGKTAAFGIPLITKLMLSPHGTALVMTPTRELAVQVLKMLEDLIGEERKTIKTVLLIGGESIFKQLQQLRVKPRLMVGTPGRINDHLMRGSLNLHDTRFLVLDETDRMLDMGFTPQIDKILHYIPTERQTLLFSATMPRNIVSMSEKYLNQPIRVSVESPKQEIPSLKQEVIYVSEQDKHNQLVDQLGKREGSIIIFVKTKFGAERIAKRLRDEKHSADAIHGNLSHSRRERAINAFRDCRYRIMVATDIAARGLDIAHVKHVINYDLPQCPEDYVHRIGRTARAGAEGSALCFVTSADRRKWSMISRLINFEGKPTGQFESSDSDARPERRRSNFAPRSSSSSSFRKPYGDRDGGSRDGGSSTGGYRGNRDGGSRDGGSSTGGYRGNRDGGSRDGGSSTGGYRGNRDSGSSSSTGGYRGNRDGGSSSRGGFGSSRDSGAPTTGGFGGNRDGGSKDSGSTGGYRGNRDGGSSSSRGGYGGGSRDGGSSRGGFGSNSGYGGRSNSSSRGGNDRGSSSQY